MSTRQEKMTSTDASLRTAEADMDDTIAVNRTVAVVEVSQLAAPPAAFRRTNVDERRLRLRVMGGGVEEEGMAALKEAAQRGIKMAAELGDRAPNPQVAEALVARISGTQSGKQRAQALLDYYTEIEDIALSDAVLFLDRVKKQFDHLIDDVPSLAEAYPKLAKFYAFKSNAITEGRAMAKAERSLKAGAGSSSADAPVVGPGTANGK